MKHYKKILSIALTASMVLGGSAVAFAAGDKEASASGEGDLQYVAKGDVFDVVFPTLADDATTFDYILDPDGLIVQTNADRYGNKQFEDGKKVYFLRSAKVNGKDYTDVSDGLTVTNKSTQEVELVVNAKVAAADGITMVADKADITTTTDKPALYLAVLGTASDATRKETAITVTGSEQKTQIATDSNAYKVSWNAAANGGKGQYEKVLTDDAKAAGYTGFKSYTFQLTGDCNTHADWAKVKDNAPKVDLVWSVKDFTVSGPQVTMDASGLITVSGLTADKNYKSMTIADADGKAQALNVAPATWNTDNWDTTNGGTFSVQLGNQWITYLKSKGNTAVVKVTLSDGSTITANGTLTQ